MTGKRVDLVHGVPHVLDDVVDGRFLPGVEPIVGVDLAQLVERHADDRKGLSHSDSRATFQPS
jgi:hypothetical protein